MFALKCYVLQKIIKISRNIRKDTIMNNLDWILFFCMGIIFGSIFAISGINCIAKLNFNIYYQVCLLVIFTSIYVFILNKCKIIIENILKEVKDNFSCLEYEMENILRSEIYKRLLNEEVIVESLDNVFVVKKKKISQITMEERECASLIVFLIDGVKYCTSESKSVFSGRSSFYVFLYPHNYSSNSYRIYI